MNLARSLFNRYTIIALSCLIIFINGCTTTQAPLELTPSPKIIEKAIKIQLEQKYQQISEQLKTEQPAFKILKINVNKIEPTIKLNLPTYHLEGNCQISWRLNKSKRKKITNNFQLDLQRQSSGKTWRLLIRENHHQKLKYRSYKI